ncbi:hypothetical protein U91I_00186 [alpha proteobacterium U9-1i]|nr:hypothetical protein U91I_00186 [alpha proteobacterium U9-1i]
MPLARIAPAAESGAASATWTSGPGVASVSALSEAPHAASASEAAKTAPKAIC